MLCITKLENPHLKSRTINAAVIAHHTTNPTNRNHTAQGCATRRPNWLQGAHPTGIHPLLPMTAPPNNTHPSCRTIATPPVGFLRHLQALERALFLRRFCHQCCHSLASMRRSLGAMYNHAPPGSHTPAVVPISSSTTPSRPRLYRTHQRPTTDCRATYSCAFDLCVMQEKISLLNKISTRIERIIQNI